MVHLKRRGKKERKLHPTGKVPFPVFIVSEDFIYSKGKRGNSHNFPKAASTITNTTPFLEQRLLPQRSKVEMHRLCFEHEQF